MTIYRIHAYITLINDEDGWGRSLCSAAAKGGSCPGAGQEIARLSLVRSPYTWLLLDYLVRRTVQYLPCSLFFALNLPCS